MCNKCYYHKKVNDGLIDPPEEVGNVATKVWDYMPLVHKTAEVVAAQFNLEYEDLVQQGYLILAELGLKLDKGMHKKQISKYIRNSVHNGLRNYVAQLNSTISIPRLNKDYYDAIPAVAGDIDSLYSNFLSPEELVLRKEAVEIAQTRVANIINTLSEREQYVLWNHVVADEPQTLRDIASEFQVTKSTIGRDIQKVKDVLFVGDSDDI